MRVLVSAKARILPSLLPKYQNYLGILVTPRNGMLPYALEMWQQHQLPWAVDNDAYSGFDEAAYCRMLSRVVGQQGCLWVNLPDVVADAVATTELFHRWKEVVAQTGQPLGYVAQDGIDQVSIPWDEIGALFVGGSTQFKLSSSASAVAREAAKRGKRVHVGRANSFKRYRYAALCCNAHTVDGTNVCRWSDQKLPLAVEWLRLLSEQQVLGLP